MLVNYENELTKLSLIDMESLINYLKAIGDEDTIAKMKSYKPKGNYEDVIFAANLAQELISGMKNFSEKFSEEEFSAVIYKLTIEKGISSLNLTRIYNRFILDNKRLNPFFEFFSKEKPAGYFTIADFKKSGSAESRSEFNQQFYDYRDKYNKYDAEILSCSLIAGSGITFDEINQKPQSVQTLAVFGKTLDNYTTAHHEVIHIVEKPPQYIPGRIILMQLSSGRYILVSNLMGNLSSVILTEQAGDKINDLLSNELVTFEKNWVTKKVDKRYRQYKDLYYRQQVNDMIIKPLYGNDWNNNPIKNISHEYFTLAKDDKANPILINDTSTVAGTLAQGLEIAQAAYVEVLHQVMDETNEIWKAIRGTIPLVNIVYHSLTDSEYKIDSGELLLDLISIIPVVKGIGVTIKSASSIMRLGSTSLKAGMKNGLRGFGLYTYVARQISPDLLSATLKNSSLMTKALYDAMEPIPLRSSLKGLYKGVKNDLKLTSLDGFSGDVLARKNIKADLELMNDGVLKDNSGKRFIRGEKGELYHVEKNHRNNRWMLIDGDKKTPIINSCGRWWRIRNETKNRELFRKKWEVNDINFEGVHSNHGIYKIRPDNLQSVQDYNYYIKNNNKFYQVKYDKENNTLRLINPTSPSLLGHYPPIMLDKNNKWVFNTNIGLKGGGKDSFLREFFGKNKHKSSQTHESSTKKQKNIPSEVTVAPPKVQASTSDPSAPAILVHVVHVKSPPIPKVKSDPNEITPRDAMIVVPLRSGKVNNDTPPLIDPEKYNKLDSLSLERTKVSDSTIRSAIYNKNGITGPFYGVGDHYKKITENTDSILKQSAENDKKLKGTLDKMKVKEAVDMKFTKGKLRSYAAHSGASNTAIHTDSYKDGFFNLPGSLSEKNPFPGVKIIEDTVNPALLKYKPINIPRTTKWNPKSDLGSYHVEDTEKYISEVKSLYEKSGVKLTPLVEKRIRDYLLAQKNILPKKAGIAGLHAEVQAFNYMVTKFNKDVTQAENLNQIYIFTKRLVGNKNNDFPACVNCSGILSGLENIMTGKVEKDVKLNRRHSW
ncbi:YwqJ-related putative deaminase [Yersinia pekkanenii]|uniref:Uncharacterized protein n=1 Tax=Yersinia pekkanenii TaxID=1288385 RepID=A0A0T9PP69_9GAMM|nr:YwqJ-related putative deaminase [Yersinia pekkanenii]CNH73215.1 Uncharacterised protein [Yersinia pekkanenii]CRY68050.1 Uncharacterised protein [Yersinia pekkanenii]